MEKMEKPVFNFKKPDKSLLKDRKEIVDIIPETGSCYLSDILEKCPKDLSYDKVIISEILRLLILT